MKESQTLTEVREWLMSAGEWAGASEGVNSDSGDRNAVKCL